MTHKLKKVQLVVLIFSFLVMLVIPTRSLHAATNAVTTKGTITFTEGPDSGSKDVVVPKDALGKNNFSNKTATNSVYKKLPQTSESRSLWATLFGVCLLVLTLVLFLIFKRRKKDEEN